MHVQIRGGVGNAKLIKLVIVPAGRERLPRVRFLLQLIAELVYNSKVSELEVVRAVLKISAADTLHFRFRMEATACSPVLNVRVLRGLPILTIEEHCNIHAYMQTTRLSPATKRSMRHTSTEVTRSLARQNTMCSTISINT